MSRGRKSGRKKLSAIIFSVVVLAMLTLLINDKTGLLKLPSVDDAYEQAGLVETTAKVESDFAVHFIDVGQGDCILVTSGSENMLIDAGESGNESVVLNYLEQHNVAQLDYVIATHPHTDHIGSMADVINALTVKNVIMPRLDKSNTPTTKAYENLLTAVKNSGAKVIAAAPGKSYALGKAQFTVLSPSVQDDNLNNMSVVVRLVYEQRSFLFMGDAETAVEKQLLKAGYDLSADVIKLGHHGSSSSSGKKFIEAVAPQYAVVTCGAGNRYGHPHSETLELMKDENICLLRTDLLGTVVIGVENSKIIVGEATANGSADS